MSEKVKFHRTVNFAHKYPEMVMVGIFFKRAVTDELKLSQEPYGQFFKWAKLAKSKPNLTSPCLVVPTSKFRNLTLQLLGKNRTY